MYKEAVASSSDLEVQKFFNNPYLINVMGCCLEYIRYKSDGKKEPFRAGPSDIDYVDYRYGHGWCSYELAFEMFTFTDGKPFGIKEE